MSTNKSWPPYKKLKTENYYITKFLLSPDTHSKYIPANENLKHSKDQSEFILLRYHHLIIKAPTSHVKPVTHIKYDN